MQLYTKVKLIDFQKSRINLPIYKIKTDMSRIRLKLPKIARICLKLHLNFFKKFHNFFFTIFCVQPNSYPN